MARLRAAAAGLPDTEVVGAPEERLPHLVTFSCLYLDGEALVTELDRHGFGVASGSACTASTLEPSHVLAAMGALTHGNVRVSLTRETTAEQVDASAGVLPEVVGRLRARAALRERGCDGPDLVLDCRGLACPMPVVELGRRIGDVPVGGVVAVEADDVAARVDVPAWCRMRAQEYLGEEAAADGVPSYRVRRVS